MTTHAPFTCLGAAIRLLGISAACAILFILDRIVPALLGFQYSRLQDATLYVWLVVLPFVGFVRVFYRCHWLSSRSSRWRWFISVASALLLTMAFAFLTLCFVWMSG
jgi:hypothetical protein